MFNTLMKMSHSCFIVYSSFHCTSTISTTHRGDLSTPVPHIYSKLTLNNRDGQCILYILEKVHPIPIHPSVCQTCHTGGVTLCPFQFNNSSVKWILRIYSFSHKETVWQACRKQKRPHVHVHVCKHSATTHMPCLHLYASSMAQE